MSYNRVAAVTGANKGIGFAIVRNLALQYPKSPYHDGPFLIYLTARDQNRGEEALQSLYSDSELKRAKVLVQDGGDATIRYHQLDISDTGSITAFADYLKKEHPDGIDFVINNAGIAMQGFDDKVVEETLHCNYHGTLTATQAFLPLLKSNGRLVNVSSMSGKLNKYTPALRDRFLSAAATSPAAVTSLMEAFKTAVAAGNEKEQGWPSAAYAVSKAGVTAMTKAVALQEKERGRGVLVNACCPGYVKTDMTRGGGSKTVDEGATTPVMLALEDVGGVTGQFWQNERVIEW
ncbi:hypothetical protein LTR16_004934 [Cryomyces antarcticus]|uniref:Carbonyl reductase n=1 Tax=Cryomyces antarcticus TaxID=329879 RepID=A0ABR0KRG7_9PEZI|nr:hypothetical protein LTR16_004934 [Cryomyces antarcticus]